MRSNGFRTRRLVTKVCKAVANTLRFHHARRGEVGNDGGKRRWATAVRWVPQLVDHGVTNDAFEDDPSIIYWEIFIDLLH